MMNSDDLTHIISGNQNNLYKLCGAKEITRENLPAFRLADQKPWPYFVFDLQSSDFDSNSLCHYLADNIDAGLLPPFVKFISPLIAKKPVANLLSAGFRPVMREKGMALKKTGFQPPSKLNEEVDICKVVKEKYLETWLKMAARVFFKNELPDKSLFMHLLASGHTKFYMAAFKNRPAGTIMTFSDEYATGIYFVSTLPTFRQLGIASKLLTHVVNELFSSGEQTIILHATPQSFYLYKAFGFKEYCNFDIYWKLGR